MNDGASSKFEFIQDFSAIEGISAKKAEMVLYTLKNMICHSIMEQYLLDTSKTSFRINVPPIGHLTLYKNDEGNWDVKDLDISQMFVMSLNQALRSKESPLYAQHSDWVNMFMKYQLNSVNEELQ